MKKSVWQLYLKDAITGGLSRISKMSDSVSGRFTRMQMRISSFASRSKKDIRDLTSQIPGLSALGPAIMNPMVMAGAAIALVAGSFVSVTKKAAAFENQFLELRQLNLEKPNEELERLNANVLKTAFSTGMLAKDTAKAYFDIQSATGKYGAEVDSIVEKTAIFARATKTNFDSAIQSVGKAINAFGMDASQMDEFFASSFKTVQVGITTFDQLAATQTDYAGAAAAANQSIDDANKLFAAFTQTAKSTREAGTLTKQTFNDLTRKSTIDGFKAIGVSLFDNAGQMKSLDAVTRELVPKLSKLSDLEFSRFKEAVGGSEGIRALLDRTKASGESLLQTFDNFDNTKFDIDAAIKNANGDLNIMSSILSNKIDTVLVRIGQKTMPDVVKGVSKMVDILDGAVSKWDDLNENSEVFNGILNAMKAGWEYTFFKPLQIIGQRISDMFYAIESGWLGIKTLIADVSAAGSKLFDAAAKAMDGQFAAAGKSLLDVQTSLTAIADIDWSGKAAKAQRDMASMLAPPKGMGGYQPFPFMTGGTAGANGNGLADNGGAVDPTDGINAVSGGGKSVRNVTVNIQKLVDAITINTSEVAGEMPNIEEMVTRVLVRAVGGAEISMSNG